MLNRPPCRPIYHHMGAVLADATLQAGLSYEKIIRPRIHYILERFPHASTTGSVIQIMQDEGTSKFLQWTHNEKISRFENVVSFISNARIENTDELLMSLREETFCSGLQKIHGIGPKTIDYMACLVGMDCVAVDRHVQNFAELAGLENNGYAYLRDVFNFAADLLDISRRDFDSLIWHYQAAQYKKQLELEFYK
ncbi:hypothetical protein [uncultured Tistrella sp.]|uniref:hypothetical protein n=1 Tax=Tistrella mobilis TaxID=171437 RepID=UPI00263988DF|nr:hypothetical protein [uncultured Tistrella sp.]